MVLLLRNAIFKSFFLNKLVIKVVPFPTYVKQAHFCVIGQLFVCRVGGFFGVGSEGKGRCVGKALCIMLRMVSSSNLYLCSRKLYVLSLLYRYLMAACLCWWLVGVGNDSACESGFPVY